MARRSRDEEFRSEYPDLYRRAYTAAFRLCGDRAAAQDLAQETLTRAYVEWDKLDERRAGWVVTTATRSAIDRWRHEARRLPLVAAVCCGVAGLAWRAGVRAYRSTGS